MRGERTVAGLRCGEVLADLSAYLDGELDADTRAAIEAHVSGCTQCARFGGQFAAVVTALRTRLAAPPDPASVQRVAAGWRG
jgi:anti-sigma factor RsiW